MVMFRERVFKDLDLTQLSKTNLHSVKKNHRSTMVRFRKDQV